MILALPETAGSALYGMLDVLAATGTIWRELVGEEPGLPLIRPCIVSPEERPFRCGNGIPVSPDVTIAQARAPDVVIVPELWLAPTDDIRDRHSGVKQWLRHCYESGSSIYSACSGSVLLAAAGLLDGREATSHWGYQDLLRRNFPKVKFNPAPNLVIADPTGRIVTAGGTTPGMTSPSTSFRVIAVPAKRYASPRSTCSNGTGKGSFRMPVSYADNPTRIPSCERLKAGSPRITGSLTPSQPW